jgi:hypothetical protein
MQLVGTNGRRPQIGRCVSWPQFVFLKGALFRLAFSHVLNKKTPQVFVIKTLAAIISNERLGIEWGTNGYRFNSFN